MEHKNISISDQVFERLEHSILVGEYQKDEILTELSLSESLGVSRTPIREAIIRLEQEKLVENTSKGIRVIGISLEDIEIIYEMRIRIEGLAGKYAVKNASEDDIKKMKETIELQEFYCSKNDADNIRNLDSEFHKILYKMTYCVPLEYTLSELHKKILKYRRVSVQKSSRAMLSVNEHKAIYEAISKRDSELAEKLIVEHIKNARNNILNMK